MNYYPKWTLITISVLLIFVIILTGKSDSNFNTQFLIIGASLLLFGLFCVIIFHKNGFIIKNSNLHIATFFGQAPVLSKKIDLSKWTSVSILKASKRMGNEDWSYREELFRLTFLNQNHTLKSAVVTAKSESEANSLLEFVLKNTNLKYEIYNPNFRKNSN